MNIRKRRFVWDNDKALANKRKHGIAFELAATLFKDPLQEAFHDWNHVDFEERWVVVGVADNGLLLLVCCAATNLEEDDFVRIISARRATSHERREYEGGDYSVREPEMTDENDVKTAADPSVVEDYDDGMKDEYDLSKAKRGVFKNCRAPVEIDDEVIGYFYTRQLKLGIDSTEGINEVLRAHVGLPKRTEPVETFREALRRHFGVPPWLAKSSRPLDGDAGAPADDAERR
jgi:uncharacterized DUF497 family protein